uniref:Synembryn n=1 Tax=Neogobius melanostomus TaxID=47308 RepID=A0A8C6WW44_9GOBI
HGHRSGGIIQCIKRGDTASVQIHLQEFNKQVMLLHTDYFKWSHVLVFGNMTVVLCWQYTQCFFFDKEERNRRKVSLVLPLSLRSLRILSRDKRVLAPLVTDSALLTLAKLAGLTSGETKEELSDPDLNFYDNIIVKEAMKVLCNVVYNSTWAQERFSTLGLISGLTQLVSVSASASPPSSVQFYELRLMFLMTALRREPHEIFLIQILCLEVQWKDQYECVLDPAAPLISLDASQRAVEILKILFNITYRTHRQEPKEEDAAQYRHLVAILRLCLMRKCVLTEDTDELQGHTINLLSALPLLCLDVLLQAPLAPGSEQLNGVNMDCVHNLLLFMERRLEQGEKVKEKLTPIINLLTESCRAHRETRKYLRNQILPPLRDVSQRPEDGSTVKSRLVRLMTHLDTDVKHCAADLIFVLCKENVRRFVKYTGYGNAAGLLATRGLLGGQCTPSSSITAHFSSDSDSDTEEYRQVKDRINPVTGRVEAQQPDPMEGMTEEEKEEEAKRLIMLFSKLSREDIIQPMGVNSEGRLVPMAGLKGNSITEEGHSDSENECEEEK